MQNEKRQLETNLVVEQRIQNRETDKDSIASVSDDEQDEDDSGSVVGNEDGTQDVFFECNPDLARLSSKPMLPGQTSTSGVSAHQYGQSQGTLLPVLSLSSCWLLLKCSCQTVDNTAAEGGGMALDGLNMNCGLTCCTSYYLHCCCIHLWHGE